MYITPLHWIAFTGGVIVLLLLDLLVLRRKGGPVSLREALVATLAWIALSAAFGGWIVWRGGPAHGLEFFTGYVIEYALSIDNIFVFVLVFASFQIAPEQQRKLLFWGVLGAMIMRGAMVAAGTALLSHFAWVIYLFGAYILYAGVMMLVPRPETPVEEKLIVRLGRRFLPLSADNRPTRFTVRENGRRKFTLLFLVLIVVEVTDLIFALDSVPAVFGVTRDPFIVYTSNICAILGLRSLYFLLAGAIRSLAWLHAGLAAVLIFIGAKMLGEHFYPVSTLVSLLIIGCILLLAVAASLLGGKKEGATTRNEP
jgi:tellurite resistance protein TerC